MYRVYWGPTVEEMLADIWLAAADRDAVVADSEWLDKKLASAPLAQGESRESSLHRFAARPPLAADYEVVPDDNLVIVQSVFPIR